MLSLNSLWEQMTQFCFSISLKLAPKKYHVGNSLIMERIKIFIEINSFRNKIWFCQKNFILRNQISCRMYARNELKYFSIQWISVNPFYVDFNKSKNLVGLGMCIYDDTCYYMIYRQNKYLILSFYLLYMVSRNG